MADAKKEEPTKPTPEEKLAAAEAEVDALVKKGLKALDDFEKLDQKQVDRIVAKASVAALNKHLVLAKMAVDETGRGLVEDKATKNIFACEHVTNYLAGQKTVGIIREDDVMGIDEIAEPVGVVAGVTPVTNPTSTAIFKSLIALKTRCPIIFGFHPGAQKCSVEAAKIVRDIYASGYPDKMILQKMVPGGDDHMRVLTAFSDENGKVRAMCLGHTMVEEHTPHGLGNHAAIVSEDTTSLPLVENIRKMLEACRYTGFSNFDIKYSGTPGDYRVFEINLRQGRSNYYVTATGMNIARLVVEKWNDGGTDCVLNKNEVFWHHVPAQVAFTYTEDKDLVARAKALKAQGKEACSLLYKPDLLWNPVRYACVLEQLRRQFKKFKTYYPVHK